MAWLSNSNFSATDKLHAVDLNNLANDIRNWGGDVNGGGYNLYNCTVSGLLVDPTTTVGDLLVHGPTGTGPGALQRLPVVVGGDGLQLVIDHTQPLGIKWGVAAGGLVDPTTTKGDLIAKPSGAPPTRLPVGSDSHILICDSSQPTGLRWGTITGFAAPGLDKQVMVNTAGVPGASAGFVYDYSKGHLLIGGGADDGTAAVVQVTGQTHTTQRIRTDMFFSAKAWPGSSSLNNPDPGYGGVGYQGGSIYWIWNGGAWVSVDYSKLSNVLADPTTNLGDLIVRGSSALGRLPVGPNTYQLVADSTQPLGMKWQAPPPTGVTSFIGRTGAVIAQTGDYSAAQVTNAVDRSMLYANPPWITSIAWGIITGAPNFLVDPTMAKGDLITRTGSALTRLPVGTTNGQYLVVDSSSATGMNWMAPSTQVVTSISPGMFSGDVIFTAGANVSLSHITNVGGQQISISVPNINSSTGMSDPTTSQGDLIVHGLTAGTTRMPIGANGQILTVDTTQDLGVKWAAPAAFVGVTSLSPGVLTGAVTLVGGTNVLVSQSGQAITIGVPGVMVDPTVNKGDIPARGASMLLALAVGPDGSTLIADSTQATGMKWGTSSMSQSPWVADVDAAGHNLNNAGTVHANAIASTGYITSVRYLATSTHLKADPAPGLGDPNAAFIEFATADPSTPLLGYVQLYNDPTVANRRLAISALDPSYGWQNVTLCETGGNVGIGTKVPIGKFTVRDSANHDLTLASMDWLLSGSVGLNATNDANSGPIPMAFYGSPFTFMSGSMGIGTTVPAATLHVVSNGSPAFVVEADGGGNQLLITGHGNKNQQMFIGYDTTNNRAVIQSVFQGIALEPVILNGAGGFVGIGTGNTNPLTTLHVSGLGNKICSNENVSSIVRFSDGGVNSHMGVVFDTSATASTASLRGFIIEKSSQDFGIVRYDSAGVANFTPDLWVSSGGNVGIGSTTSPFNRFTVVDVSRAASDAGAGAGALSISCQTGAQTDDNLLFGVHLGDYSWIQAIKAGTATRNLVLQGGGGNLGIGTTAPASQLTIIPPTNAASQSGLQVAIGEAGNSPSWRLNMGYANVSPTGYMSIIDSIVAAGGGALAINPSGGKIGIGNLYPTNQLTITPQTNPTSQSGLQVAIGEGSNNPAYRMNLGYFIYNSATWTGCIDTVANNGPTPLVLNPTGGTVGVCIEVPNYSYPLHVAAPPQNGNQGAIISTCNGGATMLMGAMNGPYNTGAMLGGAVFGSYSNHPFTFIANNQICGGFTAAGQFVIGTSPTTAGYQLSLTQDGAIKQITSSWATGSDSRLKRNIRDLVGGLDIIRKLRPIEAELNGLAGMPEGTRVVSFLAEEVQKILPGCVGTNLTRLREEDKENTEILTLNIHEILIHLVLAVQQLAAKITPPNIEELKV